MYTSIEVAKYTVSKCIDDKCPVDPLKLQFLLYYIQRDFLSRAKTREVETKCAFSESFIVGYQYPNLCDVKWYFCGAGAMPITMVFGLDKSIFSTEDMRSFDKIIEAYRDKHPFEMVKEITKKGSAYHKIREQMNDSDFSRDTRKTRYIPKSLIKKLDT